MNKTSKLCAMALLPSTLLLAGCATTQPVPVAVQCAQMAPVSEWMMAPSRNAYLTKNSSKTPPKTPKN